jgi:uncharacterized protein YutE (UPF0331/DUF86 family)
VAGLARRLAEADEALATLDEVVDKAERSIVERDGAILRLIYSFEAVWKACQQLLAEREGVEVASLNTAIRTARRLGWLSDEDAQAAIAVGRDRNLAVHMYRGAIGMEIARHLAAHAGLLHRWLAVVQRQAVAGD